MMIVSSWTIHALSLAISRQKSLSLSLSLSFFIPRIAGRSPSGNWITALGRIADWRMGEMVIARGALGGWSDSIDKKERERERETGLRLRTRRIEKSRLESHFWAARALLYNHLRPVYHHNTLILNHPHHHHVRGISLSLRTLTIKLMASLAPLTATICAPTAPAPSP